MNRVQIGHLVTFSSGHYPRLIGRVVRIVPDSEPSPLSRDYLCQVNVGGQKVLLKRLSELKPLCDRVDHIATEDVIG